MKRINYIFIIVLFAMIFSACEDFLTVRPENNQSSDQFWQTKEEVEAVLGAGYVKLRNCQESFLLWGEVRGNGIELYNDGSALQQAAKTLRSMRILPTNELAKWDKLYSVINMANSVLTYGPEVVGKDATFDINVMNSYASEAQFLRSLAYFYLVRIWGDVPYVIEPYVDDTQDYTIPQTAGKAILEDCLINLNASLESAKEKFAESSIESSINSKGRATRWAIYSLIADINLWLGNYDACLEACDHVINSGYIGLINGSLWFENFYPGNSNESIFEIQYSYTLSQTNSFISWFDTNKYYYISDYMIGLYTANASDVRGLNASYNSSAKIWKYIGINSSTSRNSSGQNDQNWIIYRLADIYLMQAECHIMKGTQEGLNEGVDLINVIRERAGILPLDGGSNQIDVLRLLLEERQREFFAEGKNWFDLLRIGSRDVSGCKELLIEQVLLVASSNTANAIRSKLNDKNSWYLPIHADELNNNEELVQNSYYDNLSN